MVIRGLILVSSNLLIVKSLLFAAVLSHVKYKVKVLICRNMS
jgi:hypothetical protein